MRKAELAVGVAAAALIAWALLRLLTFAPVGSLGSVDGQSLEVDRFGIIGFIVVGGLGVAWLIRLGNRRK